MTVVTNIRLRSSYNSVPSDNVQQIWLGPPVTLDVGTYQSIPIASIVATKSVTGGYRLFVSGRINDWSDLQFTYYKNGQQIDFSCPVGWWCGTAPYDFTYIRDFIDNINVGDIFEIYAYNRYIGTTNVTINDFTIRYSDVQLPFLNIAVFACQDEINSGKTSFITGHVFDDSGNSIDGANISLSAQNGTIDPLNGLTDINGDFKFTYTAPDITTTQTFNLTATASKSGFEDGSGSGQIKVLSVPIVTAGPSLPQMLLLGGIIFGLLWHKKCESYKNKEDCEKNDCQWKKEKKKEQCIPFTKEQKMLIDALRKQGAIGIPKCENGECKIGKYTAEYRKGKPPIIIDHIKE